MQFGQARHRRRPSLTPMIDVVFLLLVFFMLAARFGVDTQLVLHPGGNGSVYSGPPRLVEIHADGLSLNGVATDPARLPAMLTALMQSPQDTVVMRADDVPLQRVITVIEALTAAGLTHLVLVE